MRSNSLTRWHFRKMLERRVSRGAKFLDKRNPMWFESIHLPSLRLQRCEACVLGQLYGDYTDGLHAFGWRWQDDSVRCNAVTHGFLLAGSDGDHYRMLTNIWREVIQKRKEKYGMDIGKEKPVIVVEPAEDPFKRDTPAEEPVRAPVKEKEKEVVPA